MPAPSPQISSARKKSLRELGQRLRARRKQLKVNATTTAEAAGISRVTLHRIEQGEPSVTMGAYLSVIFALKLELELLLPGERERQEKQTASRLPSEILPADYPELKRLAWQLKKTRKITPKEALDLYERNWRHVDLEKLGSKERDFLKALLAAFGRERLLV
jgi:transcriptional regulator with XRE-family HTH domain